MHWRVLNLFKKKKCKCSRKSSWPGPARDRSRDRSRDRAARQRKLGQGREGRKEGKERGREGAGLRRGKERACGANAWIDGQRRDQEIERREGELGIRQNQKREGNERVAWTAVVAVCFIDRTWWRITWAAAERNLYQDVDGILSGSMWTDPYFMWTESYFVFLRFLRSAAPSV